jgi:hypothetical protein
MNRFPIAASLAALCAFATPALAQSRSMSSPMSSQHDQMSAQSSSGHMSSGQMSSGQMSSDEMGHMGSMAGKPMTHAKTKPASSSQTSGAMSSAMNSQQNDSMAPSH